MWPSWRREGWGRDRDPDIWGELYDRFYRDEGDRPGRPPRAPMADDSRARLLDAALGIVGAVRVFVDIAEDVLLDQRDRLQHDRPDPARRPEPPNSPPHATGAPRRDEARPTVQDIPMERA